jgi:hypothetical protein
MKKTLAVLVLLLAGCGTTYVAKNAEPVPQPPKIAEPPKLPPELTQYWLMQFEDGPAWVQGSEMWRYDYPRISTPTSGFASFLPRR